MEYYSDWHYQLVVNNHEEKYLDLDHLEGPCLCSGPWVEGVLHFSELFPPCLATILNHEMQFNLVLQDIYPCYPKLNFGTDGIIVGTIMGAKQIHTNIIKAHAFFCHTPKSPKKNFNLLYKSLLVKSTGVNEPLR